MTDDTPPGSVEKGESRYFDRGPSSYLRSLPDESLYACDSFEPGGMWRKMPGSGAQYCPSVSTISIIDSEDEGTLPYALKRIQRDFPRNWYHHPLGSSRDKINWHKHTLRFYGNSSRKNREPSVNIPLPGRIRSILREAAAKTHGEQAPNKKVRWDDDPPAANTRPSQRLPIDSMTPQLRDAHFFAKYKLPSPTDSSDGEE